jgi:hypothetical protein
MLGVSVTLALVAHDNVSVFRAFCVRLRGAAAAFIRPTWLCRVQGTWAASNSTLPRRAECLAARQ